MHQITKVAAQASNMRRRMFFFDSGRAAFKAYMQGIGISEGSTVLLPAYIGWSSREGSGVFDPIQELGASTVFYRVSDRLQIDVEDVKTQIAATHPQLLLLIHYFGFPDIHAELLAEYARSKGIAVVEDEAHAMLSDLVGGVCGRYGHASIFSLHKLLPFPHGGVLVLNAETESETEAAVEQMHREESAVPFYEYDLYAIAQRRRCNAFALLGYLRDQEVPVDPLHTHLPDGVIPQSLPVLIPGSVRDEMYFRLNAHDLGVVSLYHTLVDQIRPDTHPESFTLSRNILNLPIHQDASLEILKEMALQIKRQLSLVTSVQNVASAPI